MGMLFSKVWSRMLGNQEMKILMLGLDAAGKTTILYRLKLAEVVTTIPTVAWPVTHAPVPRSKRLECC